MRQYKLKSRNKNAKKTVNDVKIEMIAEDYNRGTTWQERFDKKRLYGHFEGFLARWYGDMIMEIVNEIRENEEL